MSFIVKANETREQIVRGQTIGRLKLNAFLSHGAVNTDITPDMLDLSKIFVKVILTRNREDHVIFSDKVIFWALDSALDNNFNFIHPLNTTAANIMIVLAKGAAVKEQALKSIVLDLPGVINVKDSDSLKIEVSLASSPFHADLDSSVSYVECEIEQFIGYEEFIPQIKVFTINAGDSTFSPAIGNDVVKMSLINLDKASILEADAIIQAVSLKSDKYVQDSTWRQLIARRYYDIVNPTEAANLRQSHLIYQGLELDGVSVNFQLNSANVASAKNAVVVSYMNASHFTASRALDMVQKHKKELVNKIVNRG